MLDSTLIQHLLKILYSNKVESISLILFISQIKSFYDCYCSLVFFLKGNNIFIKKFPKVHNFIRDLLYLPKNTKKNLQITKVNHIRKITNEIKKKFLNSWICSPRGETAQIISISSHFNVALITPARAP